MRPVALTIAGSDSGGGAGIQADLKTFHAFGVFGTSAVTAITVQDTHAVSGVHLVPVDVVAAQVAVVAEDLRPAACKSGMLGTSELVRGVADAIERAALRQYVLDPVMVATSGDRLLDEVAVADVRARLLPLAAVVTPNLDEAALLTGIPAEGVAAMPAMAEALVAAGADSALVKGGHLEGDSVVDVWFDGDRLERWERPRVRTSSTHGTGCTLSAAIAAGLAWGRPLRQSIEDALDFVHRAIASAPGLGGGHGPLNHFVEATSASPAPAPVRSG